MKLLRMIEDSVNERYVDDIVRALRDGKIAVLPTDSLYALICDAMNPFFLSEIESMESYSLY